MKRIKIIFASMFYRMSILRFNISAIYHQKFCDFQMTVCWSPVQWGVLNRANEIIYASPFYKLFLELLILHKCLLVFSFLCLFFWTPAVLCSKHVLPVGKGVFFEGLKVSKLFVQCEKYLNVYDFCKLS